MSSFMRSVQTKETFEPTYCQQLIQNVENEEDDLDQIVKNIVLERAIEFLKNDKVQRSLKSDRFISFKEACVKGMNSEQFNRFLKHLPSLLEKNNINNKLSDEEVSSLFEERNSK